MLGRRVLSSFVTLFVRFNGLERKDLLEKKLTMREGVASRVPDWGPDELMREPNTGVLGALPRLHAFSYDVSGKGNYFF